MTACVLVYRRHIVFVGTPEEVAALWDELHAAALV